MYIIKTKKDGYYPAGHIIHRSETMQEVFLGLRIILGDNCTVKLASEIYDIAFEGENNDKA